MNIKWVQYLTKKNNKRKEKKLVREQYKLVKYKIYSAMKAGKFYTYYHGCLFSEVVDKLRQKGFKIEKIDDYNEKWHINWET